MSRKAKRSTPDRATDRRTSALSAGKRKLFRWLAAVAIPLLILLASEIGLRLAGWAYPTHFFVSSGTGVGTVLAENEKFGWRFFPRSLAREPDPIRLARTRPPNTRRIFVFGESAALGDPEPAYGFSRILRSCWRRVALEWLSR